MLIEEGAHLPLESAPHFSREEILQKYRNAGINIALGKGKVAYVEGRCVGGGSEINRGLYHRTPPEILDAWGREFGVDGLSASALQPHFDACEEIARVSYLPGAAPAISLKLHEGATNLGWQSVEVPRLFSYAEDWRTGPPGRKQSMTATFVPRFVSAGGRLVAETRARRLSRHGGRWLVRAEQAGADGARRALEIGAQTVFIAGGAVQTPALLRRSGITRNVGNTLGFHPMVKVVACFAEEVNLPGELEPVHQVKEFDPRFSLGCSMSKRPALALAMVEQPAWLAEIDSNWRHMAIYYAQTTGGRAVVRTLPGFRDPLVRVRHDPQDMRDLAQGLRALCRCLFAAGALAVYPSLAGCPVLRSESDLDTLPEELPPGANVTALHLFASCPMGENASRCATDSFGKVHGADGLHVADASLLCGPTVVNPQGSVMAVAHRNALRFLEGEGRLSRRRCPPASRQRSSE
jgi:choline dehydrogenase-like flavoprotein